MSGLFFIAVLAILGVAAIHVARRIARPIRNTRYRIGVTALLTVAFMTLLVVDELIGGYQFRALCRENAVLRIDVGKAKGRMVRVVFQPSNEILRGTAIPILHSHKSYRDVATSEEVASNEWYVAKGGWFIRMFDISEWNNPLTFGPPYCYPSLLPDELAKTYGLTLIK